MDPPSFFFQNITFSLLLVDGTNSVLLKLSAGVREFFPNNFVGSCNDGLFLFFLFFFDFLLAAQFVQEWEVREETVLVLGVGELGKQL